MANESLEERLERLEQLVAQLVALANQDRIVLRSWDAAVQANETYRDGLRLLARRQPVE